MAYFKQSYGEAQGTTITLDEYRKRKTELGQAHGEKVFAIQAKYEKLTRTLKGQIKALNKEKDKMVQEEMASYKQQLNKLKQLLNQ